MSATAVEERQRETAGGSAPTEEGAGRRRVIVVVGCALAALVLAGVTTWALIGRDEGESGRGTVPSLEVARWDASVQDAARRVDELERALRSPQNQPNGSAVFTQDVVWEDWGVRFVGFDAVMSFLRMWALTSGASSSEYTRSYAGHSGGVATESVWGAFGWTKEDPGLWLTELSIRDGKIAVVRLLGDLGVMAADRLPPGVDTPAPATVQAIRDLARAYAGAWSSGDSAAVGRLYADDSAREDTVLGETGVGRAEIEAIASRFHGRYPGARFAVVRPYSVGEPAVPGRPVIAAELALAVPAADGTPCTVKPIVVLETQEGLISRERVYYNADSLVACGWTR